METTTHAKSLTRFDYEKYVQNGIAYQQYQENFAAELALGNASKYA